jgi:hypothetical protein
MMMRLLWILVSIVMIASAERNASAKRTFRDGHVGNANYPDTEAT